MYRYEIILLRIAAMILSYRVVRQFPHIKCELGQIPGAIETLPARFLARKTFPIEKSYFPQINVNFWVPIFSKQSEKKENI